jgi:hypothetical protein
MVEHIIEEKKIITFIGRKGTQIKKTSDLKCRYDIFNKSKIKNGSLL